MKKTIVLLAFALAAGSFGCSSADKKTDTETQAQTQADPFDYQSAESEASDDTMDTDYSTGSDYTPESDYSFDDSQTFGPETEEEASAPSLGAGSSGRGH